MDEVQRSGGKYPSPQALRESLLLSASPGCIWDSSLESLFPFVPSSAAMSNIQPVTADAD